MSSSAIDLGTPCIQSIRQAAALSKTDTALSGDFFHPRTLSVVEDLGVALLGDLIVEMERSGCPPIQLLTLVFLDILGQARRRQEADWSSHWHHAAVGESP